MIPEITVKELQKLQLDNIDHLILDVRNQNEYEICNLGGLLIPMAELPARISELNRERFTIIHCHGGGRSARATEFLQSLGFTQVFNLKGGITAWANEIDTSMKKY